MRILNFGSLNLDYVYQVSHFVRPGETISSFDRKINCGGKGLNQSIALARAGAQVWHAGAVGAEDGLMLCEALKREHVDISCVKHLADVSSGHAIIQVDENGQNCILLYGGANQTIDKVQVDATLQKFSPGDFLILQNEISCIGYLMHQAHQKGMKIVLNPSPMDEQINHLPLELVDYFLLNEVEAIDICEKSESLLDELSNKFSHAKIVLTLGKQGACYRDGDQLLSHGIYDVPVIDTTAAGDTFTGFFIGSITQGYAAEQALRFASIASSIAVSRKGAEPSIPYMEEVQNSRLQLL